MAARGILSTGGYIPRTRLSRAAIADAHQWANPNLRALAKNARSAAYWDEDAITMAVEAGHACLEGADEQPEAVMLASTRMPFADRQNAGIARLALGLGDFVETMDIGGSQRAGVSALIQALTRASDGSSLVIASNKSQTKVANPQELTHGDGAASLLVGSGDESLADYVGHVSMAADLVDHYRESANAFDYSLEDRWVRDEGYDKLVPAAVIRLLTNAGLSADAVDHFILQAPSASLEKRMAKKLGIAPAAAHGGLFDGCGYTGAAQPLMALVETLEMAEPGQIILLIGFGQGVDALLLRTGAGLANYASTRPLGTQRANGTPDSNYLRFLSFNDRIEIDWGMRAERDERTAQSVAYRKTRDIYAFEGGVCRKCNTHQFPRSNVCINPNCREIDSQEPVSFRDTAGWVKTFTEDWQAYTPSPPLVYGNIEFEGGGNLLMEITDCDEGQIGVGSPVSSAFRIKDIDRRRGFRRYFWKAVPKPTAEGADHG